MITTTNPKFFNQLIKTKAFELGFGACGITRPKRLENDSFQLLNWLKEGNQGTMDYIARRGVSPASAWP